jgi:RyR domain-containing protein
VLALARLEHERWMRERRAHGFFHARHRLGRGHPDLVPWEQLSDEAREKTMQSIRDLPRLLARAGFEILRLGSAPRRRPARPHRVGW